MWWQILFISVDILVYFNSVTVVIVLILSGLSGRKETVVVAGVGAKSAVVRSGDVGGRNTESLNTTCPSSKFLISCGKLAPH